MTSPQALSRVKKFFCVFLFTILRLFVHKKKSSLLFLRFPLFRAEQAVAGVAQAGADIGVGVELAVDGGGEDRHVGMVGGEGCDTSRGGEEADDFDVLRAGLFE